MSPVIVVTYVSGLHPHDWGAGQAIGDC